MEHPLRPYTAQLRLYFKLRLFYRKKKRGLNKKIRKNIRILTKRHSFYAWKKRIRHIWWRFRWLILVYILFCILWGIMVKNPEKYAPLIDKAIGMKEDKSFFQSWFPSFTEDIVFWGIGFLGLIFSTKLLNDESFQTRLNSLANGSKVTKSADLQLQKAIKKKLYFDKKYVVNLKIKEIDPEKKYLFLFVTLESRIVNMCENDEISVDVQATVECGPQKNHKYGYISKLSITTIPANYSRKYTKKPISIIDGEIQYITEKDWERSFTFPLLGNEEADLNLYYAIWLPYNGSKSKISDKFVHPLHRYTENYNIFLTNETKENIKFACEYDLKTPYEVSAPEKKKIVNTIDPNTTECLASEITFKKGSRVEVFFGDDQDEIDSQQTKNLTK